MKDIVMRNLLIAFVLFVMGMGGMASPALFEVALRQSRVPEQDLLTKRRAFFCREKVPFLLSECEFCKIV